MNNPLISIYITTYNDLFFLKQCLKSVERQTYKNIEIIIADDSSTDGTESYFMNIGHKKKNLKYFRSEKNYGQVINQQKYIHHAQGELITILQSDDYYLTDDFLTVAANSFEANKNLAIFYCACRYSYYGTRKYSYIGSNSDHQFRKGPKGAMHMLHYGIWPSSLVAKTTTFRKVGGFRTDIGLGTDGYCAAALASEGDTFYSAEVHINARVHRKSLTGKLGWIALTEMLIPLATRIGEEIFGDRTGFQKIIVDNLNNFKKIKNHKKGMIQKIINLLVKQLDLNSNVLIYGTGRHTDNLFENTNINKLKIKYFSDSDTLVQGKTYRGLPVLAPNKIRAMCDKGLIDIIIISSMAYQEEIYETLTSLDLKNVFLHKLY